MTDADLPRCRNCFAVLGFITLTSGSKVPYTAPAAFQPRRTRRPLRRDPQARPCSEHTTTTKE